MHMNTVIQGHSQLAYAKKVRIAKGLDTNPTGTLKQEQRHFSAFMVPVMWLLGFIQLQKEALTRTTSYLKKDLRSQVTQFVERLTGVQIVANSRLSPETQCCVLESGTLSASWKWFDPRIQEIITTLLKCLFGT